MPTYDYRCEVDEQVYEVKHAMAVTISNWGELCQAGDLDPGKTPLESAVTKLMSGGGVVSSAALKNPEAPPCMTGQGCSGGGCGF